MSKQNYQRCIICCIVRLTMVIPIQQEAPRRSGFPPDFINFITLLFRPMAAMAIMMKNLDSSFSDNCCNDEV